MSKSDFSEAFKRETYFPKTKIGYWTLRKLRALKTRYVGSEGWNKFLEYLTRDVNLEPTLHERVQEGSYRNLLHLWMQNYGELLPYIRYGDDIQITIPPDYHQSTIADLVESTPLIESDPDYEKSDAPITEYKGVKVKHVPKGSAVVVGRGPSLFQHKHCEMLAESDYGGLVIASDGGMIPLLDAGVIPDVVVTVDGAPIIKKYFEHPLLEKHGKDIKWVVSVTASPEVYHAARNVGIRPHWFNPIFDDWRQNESFTRIQALMTRTERFKMGTPRLSATGHAGGCAWNCAMSIFKRSPIALIGLDLGYPEGTKLEDTQYYSSVLRIAEGNTAVIREAYKEFYHPVWKKKAFVDLVFYHYRQSFIELQQATDPWYRLYGGTINCTMGGTLFGQEIKCMGFKEFLERYPK